MSGFEIFLLILVVVAALLGFRSGIVKQIGQITGIIIGVILCRMFSPALLAWMIRGGESDSTIAIYTALAYGGLFIVCYIAVFIVASLISKLLSGLQLGIINRLAGALFKVVLWLFIFSVGYNIWVAISPSPAYSLWQQRVLDFASSVLGYVGVSGLIPGA